MKKIFTSSNAPKPVGTYSQAVESNGFVFLSGQIPLKPDGTMVSGDFPSQAVQVFENLKAVLEAAGLDFSDAVKVNVYLVDLNDFAEFNFVYSKYFSAPFPARAVVQVSALPKGARLEIELIAARR